MFKKIAKKKVVWISLTISLIVGIFVFIGCHTRNPEKRAEWITEKIASELELNEGQKKMLDDMKIEFLAKRRELNSDNSRMKDELIAQLKSDKIDRKKLDEIINIKKNEIDSIISLLTDKFLEFHDVLTQEQKLQLVAHLEKMKNRHEKRNCGFYNEQM